MHSGVPRQTSAQDMKAITQRVGKHTQRINGRVSGGETDASGRELPLPHTEIIVLSGTKNLLQSAAGDTDKLPWRGIMRRAHIQGATCECRRRATEKARQRRLRRAPLKSALSLTQQVGDVVVARKAATRNKACTHELQILLRQDGSSGEELVCPR